MHIWPAIDLRGGRCVRLVQGDYDRELVFGEDPAAMARQWVDGGAERLHVVDLDGAKDGLPKNADAVRAIRAAVDIELQLGGGVRTTETLKDWFDLGVDRLVVGTAALKNPDWFRGISSDYPGRCVLGIDARDGMVATEGWLETSSTPAAELAAQFTDQPLAGIVYTDIARDGMLTGPNLEAVKKMQSAVTVPLIASGGVARIEDVAALAGLAVDGCIIGRALYERKFELADALQLARESKTS